MIKSGCPEQICNKCGKARKLVYEVIGTAKQKWGKGIKMEEIVGEGSVF